MPNSIPAAATGLPKSRRTFLQGMAALPAISIPAVASAASLRTDASPDAALIAHAAKAEALAVRAEAAVYRTCDLDSRLDALQPLRSKPSRPAPLSEFATEVEHEPDGSFTLRSIRTPIDAVVALAFEEQKAACDTWDAENEAIRRRLGFDAAIERCTGSTGTLKRLCATLRP